MDADERALLTEWLRDSAASPKWRTLLTQAGTTRIELAERLAQRALTAGLCTVSETFEKGGWRRTAISWVELESLQAALGLTTRSERDGRREQLARRLDALMVHAVVGEAAQALAESRMALVAAEARANLLEALLAWVDASETGLRRDFGLRLGHTKAVGDGEWQWLERHFDLPALGISAFAPTLTLAGDLVLQWPAGRRIDLGALPFVTLPAAALDELQAATAPSRWWLIENRASFEKQAARRAPGDVLLWIAGRPTRSWLTAVGRLLWHAPAPAAISADADPAGIEIAMAAAAPWVAAGLAWQAHAMEPERLQRANLPPLGAYDRATLQRLAGCSLPVELAALRDALAQSGVKAEQEAWL